MGGLCPGERRLDGGSAGARHVGLSKKGSALRNAPRGTCLAVMTGVAIAVAAVVLASSALAGETPPAGHPVPGDGSLRYKSYLFQLPGKVKLTFYEDVNGDSLVDVLAVHGSEKADEPARNLVIFLQRPDG